MYEDDPCSYDDCEGEGKVIADVEVDEVDDADVDEVVSGKEEMEVEETGMAMEAEEESAAVEAGWFVTSGWAVSCCRGGLEGVLFTGVCTVVSGFDKDAWAGSSVGYPASPFSP